MLGDDTKVREVFCASVTRKNAKPLFDGNSLAQVEVLKLPTPYILSQTA